MTSNSFDTSFNVLLILTSMLQSNECARYSAINSLTQALSLSLSLYVVAISISFGHKSAKSRIQRLHKRTDAAIIDGMYFVANVKSVQPKKIN